MENSLNNSEINIHSIKTNFLQALKAMLAFEPAVTNILAIALAIGLLLLLSYPTLFPKFGKFNLYFTYFIYGLIVFHTIKSASKSLIIPITALFIASIGFIIICLGFNLSIISTSILKMLMLLGAIGISTYILAMK